MLSRLCWAIRYFVVIVVAVVVGYVVSSSVASWYVTSIIDAPTSWDIWIQRILIIIGTTAGVDYAIGGWNWYCNFQDRITQHRLLVSLVAPMFAEQSNTIGQVLFTIAFFATNALNTFGVLLYSIGICAKLWGIWIPGYQNVTAVIGTLCGFIVGAKISNVLSGVVNNLFQTKRLDMELNQGLFSTLLKGDR